MVNRGPCYHCPAEIINLDQFIKMQWIISLLTSLKWLLNQMWKITFTSIHYYIIPAFVHCKDIDVFPHSTKATTLYVLMKSASNITSLNPNHCVPPCPSYLTLYSFCTAWSHSPWHHDCFCAPFHPFSGREAFSVGTMPYASFQSLQPFSVSNPSKYLVSTW